MHDEELFATALEIRILTKIMIQIATRSQEQHLQAHGASCSTLQHGIMRQLYHHQYTSSELSRRMYIDPATLVPVVDALERQGYVQRGKDPSDRRRNPLSLTESGAELLAQIPLFDHTGPLASGLASLGNAQARELLRLLRELIMHMAPDIDLVGEQGTIAQTAREMFQTQAHITSISPGSSATDDGPQTTDS
jgi:DNA-binding MarR family transcriptional regulator